MLVQYTVTPKSLAQGARRHFRYRHKIQLAVSRLTSIFLILIGAGSFFVLNESPMLNGLLVSFGVFMLILASVRARMIGKASFKGRQSSISVSIEIQDDRFVYKTEDSNSALNWSSFVDRQICPDGLLIYPQKNFFIWIPADASIQGGDWTELKDLVETRISRKI